MNIRDSIQEKFGDNVFERPIFYTNPGGLRFELSEGGDWVEKFNLAFKKASTICSSILDTEFTVCIRIWGSRNLVASAYVLKELARIGLYPDIEKEHWSELDQSDDWGDDEPYWHTIAFKLPKSELGKILWCNLTQDYSVIGPSPDCDFYIFDIEKGVEIWPYDDCGMDVVGSNHELLAQLYSKYHSYLLEYDMPIMEETFGKP